MVQAVSRLSAHCKAFRNNSYLFVYKWYQTWIYWPDDIQTISESLHDIASWHGNTFRITGLVRGTRRLHDEVIKWKHFPRYWPFVRGIHRSPVNSLHKGQWRGALMFSLIYAWINDWVNNREAADLRRHSAHFEVTVMCRWLLSLKDQ